MSNQITTAFVQEFKRGVDLLVQQRTSLLRSAVRVETVQGKKASFDQVGVVAARKRTSRHADTPRIDTPHKRRWVTLTDYEIADLIDEQDKVRTLNDPANAYSQTFAAALGRAMDAETIAAALGLAYTGEDGTASVALPGTQVIAAGGTGFSLTKLAQAMEKLKLKNAVEPGAELWVAWTAKQEREFLTATEVKSIDYNTQKVLVDGGMGEGRFYGFRFLRLEDWQDETGITQRILPFDSGTTTRSCVAWVKDGLLLGLGKDIGGQVDRRADKSYATQAYASMSIGASRMQEEKVVQIDCIES